MARMAVSEVVKTDARDPHFSLQDREMLGQVLWVDRRAVLAREDQAVIGVRRSPRQSLARLPCVPRLERGERRLVKRYRAVSSVRLWLRQSWLVIHHDQRPAYGDPTLDLVDVPPHEPEDFSPAHPRHRRQQKGGVEPVALRRLQEPPKLLARPSLHCLGPRPGSPWRIR